jgi:hypothetical protein
MHQLLIDQGAVEALGSRAGLVVTSQIRSRRAALVCITPCLLGLNHTTC